MQWTAIPCPRAKWQPRFTQQLSPVLAHLPSVSIDLKTFFSYEREKIIVQDPTEQIRPNPGRDPFYPPTELSSLPLRASDSWKVIAVVVRTQGESSGQN